MGDTLGKLVKSKRVLEQRTTNQNLNKVIKELNKYSNGYGFAPIPKTANVKQVNHAKKIYDTRLAYDIVTKAIEEGNTVVASTYNVDLKKSDDTEDHKLSEYAVRLAQAKKLSNRHFKKEDKKEIIENGNQHIKGYGNEGMMKLFEESKSKTGIEKLIKEISSQDPKQIFYDKKLKTFEKTFQKIEGRRADDIAKVKEHLSNLPMDELEEKHTLLLQTLELYYNNDKEYTGKFKDEEQELANNRLDDIMIQLELKKTGKQKVKKTYDKYAKKLETWNTEKENKKKKDRHLGERKRGNRERTKIKNKN